MKYRVKVEPTEECNPAFAPDGKLTEGLECDGFVILTFHDDAISAEALMGCSVENLKDYLLKRESKTAHLFRMANAIADGVYRSMEIHREYEVRKAMGKIVDETRREGKETV